MKRTPVVMMLATLVLVVCSPRPAAAQSVQPIVLTQSPNCCQNPATLASTPMPLPCGDQTYLLPEDRDPVRVISTSSRLAPLPTPQAWRGYDSQVRQVSGYADAAATCTPTMCLPPTSVQALRPVTVTAPAPTVPDGYVVGKGLIGQPKLYKPGQPIRNFLRYITL